MTAPSSTDTGTDSTTAPATGDENALGDPGKAALTAERKAKRAAEAALAEATAKLTELENAGKSEAEKLQARAEKAEQELAAVTLANLKREVAEAAKLPAKLAARLIGSTRDDLETDAKTLAAELPATEPTTTATAPAGTKPTVTLRPVNGGAPAALALNDDRLVQALQAKLGAR